MRTNKWYGWIPDLPDQRDYVYMAPVAIMRKLPAKTDLRENCPPVYDQGELGSCTANAIGAAHHFDQMKQQRAKWKGERAREGKKPANNANHRESDWRGLAQFAGTFSPFTPSRLFIYYNERVIEGTVDEDAGAMIRDGIKTIAKQGVCPESRWPYVISKYRAKPGKSCYKEALDHQALTYYSVKQNLNQMKGCLAAGYPFVFGFSVYESFESETVARTGKAPMPKKNETMLGGHAVMAVGYDNAQKRFIVRNSWGTKWGLKGCFTMPYDYLLDPDLAADFWTVRLVE